GKIRRWRMEDGKEVGIPMDAGDPIWNIAVSLDGKWVVSGTMNGKVTVWNAKSHEKATEFKGHSDRVFADVSPDGTIFATGSHDKTAGVWSLSTGQRLLGPWKHEDRVVTVKFSPDGRLIATAAWSCDSVRIYDSQNGDFLVDFAAQVSSSWNQCLAWASNSEQLFTLSREGYIKCFDVSMGMTLSQWSIVKYPECIALASNETFMAVSSKSSVSFWDTTTHKQIGYVIEHPDCVVSMAISVNHVLAMGRGNTISLRSLRDILPSHYF
ncbi:WD40-repeat-containing domain protein, partial [Lanmaoa asiatica]